MLTRHQIKPAQYTCLPVPSFHPRHLASSHATHWTMLNWAHIIHPSAFVRIENILYSYNNPAIIHPFLPLLLHGAMHWCWHWSSPFLSGHHLRVHAALFGCLLTTKMAPQDPEHPFGHHFSFLVNLLQWPSLLQCHKMWPCRRSLPAVHGSKRRLVKIPAAGQALCPSNAFTIVFLSKLFQWLPRLIPCSWFMLSDRSDWCYCRSSESVTSVSSCCRHQRTQHHRTASMSMQFCFTFGLLVIDLLGEKNLHAAIFLFCTVV